MTDDVMILLERRESARNLEPDPDLTSFNNRRVLLRVSGVRQLSMVPQSGGDQEIKGVTMVTRVPQLLVRLVKDHSCKQRGQRKKTESGLNQDQNQDELNLIGQVCVCVCVHTTKEG